jgi:hypothetical protein
MKFWLLDKQPSCMVALVSCGLALTLNFQASSIRDSPPPPHGNCNPNPSDLHATAVSVSKLGRHCL